MNDFFLAYALGKRENWFHLRNTVNIYLNEYAKKYKKTDGFHYVEEDIEVETRYAYYVNKETRQPEQDFKMLAPVNDNLTFLEFQNSKYSVPPLEIRASEYTYLAIKNAKAEVSQIWFLREGHDVLQEGFFSNYRWKNDVNDKYYPRKINTMFVNLPKLAKEDTVCGELSKFLLGEVSDVVNEELKPIIEMFKREFEVFKESEEVIDAMTILEEKLKEREAEVIFREKKDMIFSALNMNLPLEQIAALARTSIEEVLGIVKDFENQQTYPN